MATKKLYSLFTMHRTGKVIRYERVPNAPAVPKPVAVRIFQDHLLGYALGRTDKMHALRPVR